MAGLESLTVRQQRTIKTVFDQLADSTEYLFNQNEEQGFDDMPEDILVFATEIIKLVEDLKIQMDR